MYLKEFKDNFFDFILDGHCLHCIIGKDRKIFLRNVHRVLKPGGIFIVMTMCGEVKGRNLKKYFDEKTRLIIKNRIAVRYIGLAEDILREINDQGFKIIKWKIKKGNRLLNRMNLLSKQQDFNLIWKFLKYRIQ